MNTVDESISKIVEQELIKFLKEFIDEPYLCYTEHGLHALFFQRLYDAIPEEYRYLTIPELKGAPKGKSMRVCRIQKEYPTAGKLDKSRRQNWDIAVIAEQRGKNLDYDYLRLLSIVEFGLNANLNHLTGDINRVCHKDANKVDNAKAYVVHLYRLSTLGNKLSARDDTKNCKEVKEFIEFAEGNGSLCALDNTRLEVDVFFGLVDVSESKGQSRLFRIRNGQREDLLGGM